MLLEPSTPKSWNILTIAEGREHVAAAFLLYCGIERYLPMQPVHYRLGPTRRRTVAMRPIFPGYLFVPAGHDRWGDLHMCPSIRGFLRNGEWPALLSFDAIALIQSTETEMATQPIRSARWSFDVGDTVRYCRRYWPFDGSQGILRRLDKRDRVVIEIMMPGRAVAVDTSAQWLKKIQG